MRLAAIALAASTALAGCADQAAAVAPPQPRASAAAPCPDPPKYQPAAAFSGAAFALPPVPDLAPFQTKQGDAWTVAGVSHVLRSRFHRDEVDGKKIAVVGWIVRTNYEDAPACALHKIGRADPPGCSAPVPAFTIADARDDKPGAARIEVMGWASNFAQIVTLLDRIGNAPPKERPSIRAVDEFWGNALPNPIPSVGARVKVSGSYGVTFTKSSGGAAANPRFGILTADRIEVLEPAPAPAVLGKRKP